MNNLDLVSIFLTTIFFLFLISYYLLFLVRRKKYPFEKNFKKLSIIIPAHNEEEYIAETLRSVLRADFDGEKEIIVIDDASKDRTAEIVSKFDGVKLISNKKQCGKSHSLNIALKKATGDAVAIIDGDSWIKHDALQILVDEISMKGIAAACSVVRVHNRKRFFCIWRHIEIIYNSMISALFSRINANVVTPGALSVYRKDVLDSIGGFSTEGFSEDVDIGIRIIRKGFRIHLVEEAVSDTNMPYRFKEFVRQRMRLARGMINLLKKHMKLNKTVIDMYTLPLFLFTYVQAIIMGGLTIYQIVSGYLTYFVSKGVYFNFEVLRFFFDWLSIFGFLKWMINIFSGVEPLSFIAVIGVASTLLTYPLYLVAIIKYDKKIDIFHVIAFLFMAPYWLAIMVLYTIALPELFMKKQYNIWKKNE